MVVQRRRRRRTLLLRISPLGSDNYRLEIMAGAEIDSAEQLRQYIERRSRRQ